MTRHKLYTSKAWLQSELTKKSVEQIAKEQNVTAQTIYNWAKNHGLMQ